nr:hypothetical protein [Tanacetum cinerariifolium]
MDVRRIKEEVELDFLSDAHSRTGHAESGDSCEIKDFILVCVSVISMEKLVRIVSDLLCGTCVDLYVIVEMCSLGSDVRTLSMEEANATKYSIRPGAEIEESNLIGLELEQKTTKVVVIKERLKEAKDRVVRFGKKSELAPRLFARLIEEFRFALHRASQAGQSCAETCGTAGYDPPQMIVIVGTTRCAKVMIEALEREGLERP